MRKFIIIGLLGLFALQPVQAQVKLDGQFKANQNCPAVASIKKGTNPGNVSIVSGQTYRLLGQNKENASHLWIEVPGATPLQRWVEVACGDIDAKTAPQAQVPASGAAVDTPNGTVKPKPQPKGPKGGTPSFVLALSWEPAFCEAMKGKAECRGETAASYEATHFSLHGLWPQPRRNVFCGVSRDMAARDDQHQWESLPEPKLSSATKAALDQVMPGTQSVLERHEWIKHGTCYPGGEAEQYFKDAVRLVNDVNASVVQGFMANHIGQAIKAQDLRAKFDEAYGRDAGLRVHVSCDKTGLISELTIGLRGNISSGTPLAQLIAAADETDEGCAQGIVDAVN